MENRRFMLIALLAVVVFFLYQAWQDDYGSRRQTSAPTAAVAKTGPVTDAVAPALGGALAPAGDVPVAVPAVATDAGAATVAEQKIKVITDVVVAEISLRGGEIKRLELSRYPVSKKIPDAPLPFLNDRDGQAFTFQSGLAGTARPITSGETVFNSAQTEYRLADGANQVEVTLEHVDTEGVQVHKTFRFTRGSYRIDLEQSVVNAGSQPLVVSPYARFVRNEHVVGDLPRFAKTFIGVGFYERKSDGKKFRFVKTKLDKLGESAFEKRQTGGWISMLEHYFVAAILPPLEAEGVFSAKAGPDHKFNAQYVETGVSVAPGATQKFPISIYAGPRLQDSVVLMGSDGKLIEHAGLNDVTPGLEYTVDYGILTPICEPLFWLLAKFHSLTGNWGISIILLTLVVKGLFYKLSEAQYRSMAKMKKFAPRIQDIKERYGEDRERMSKAMMDLYKKEGFNPLAGCWPLLVQFPVFIALYWVLLESVELRQADFALWINDLSAPDPFYVLPLLFGITFFIQQKWSGSTATMDPTQQKIMNVMPIMMTAFFTFFQAGLVLYWLVSNLIGMGQQWLINRKLTGEGLGRAKPA